ncbi:MAG: hypothetical protein OEY14_18975, partial [Myxococcales bacterium]|nr:hypothetical protein [Myxococcales bacterium]
MLPAAGLYPADQPRPTESRAEITVFEALRAGGLPRGWFGWHALRIRDPGGYHAEGDFIFAVPGRGLLALECKGGRIQ